MPPKLPSKIRYGPITPGMWSGTVSQQPQNTLTLADVRRIKDYLRGTIPKGVYPVTQAALDAINRELRKPPKSWKPTVPHPLLAIDEELHRHE